MRKLITCARFIIRRGMATACRSCGLDFPNADIGNMEEKGILESFRSKMSALHCNAAHKRS
eukprot:2475229-Amphidinium_carterae.1